MPERKTIQRRAIRRVFDEIHRPLTPDEVRAAAQKHAPGLGMATVYRALRRLLEEGWLIPVELPGEVQRYERAGKEHHHHFYCRSCQRVYEVEGCAGRIESLTPAGVLLEGHELILYGRCASCPSSE